MRDLEKFSTSKILITGGSGQIGSELKSLENIKGNNFLFPSSQELNLLDFNSIEKYFERYDLSLIINLAAFTNVQASEINKKESNLVNNLAVQKIAQEAKKRKIGLIQASTDYVFGENSIGPFKPYDKKKPINYYGLTKSKGEDSALSANDKSIIIRFASVFSEYGNNFVKTILKKLITENNIYVVSDQKISLTYAADFSENIFSIINLYNNLDFEKDDRIFHFASFDYTDWFSVAKIIYDEVNNIKKDFLKSNLIPIKLDEWNTNVKRPIDSRIYIDKALYGKNDINISKWESSVRIVVNKIFNDTVEEVTNGG